MSVENPWAMSEHATRAKSLSKMLRIVDNERFTFEIDTETLKQTDKQTDKHTDPKKRQITNSVRRINIT